MAERVKLEFYDTVLRPDPSRTVVRPFEPGYPKGYDQGPSTRTQEVIDQIVELDEEELARQLEGLTASLDENHRDVDAMLRRRFQEVADQIVDLDDVSDQQQRLIGAYFSQEYAYEAAALFNPVRRQNIWRRSRRKLADCGPRLGGDVKRRACGAASADVRWSVA